MESIETILHILHEETDQHSLLVLRYYEKLSLLIFPPRMMDIGTFAVALLKRKLGRKKEVKQDCVSPVARLDAAVRQRRGQHDPERAAHLLLRAHAQPLGKPLGFAGNPH